MKIKFNSQLGYQNEAIDSVIDLFQGLATKVNEFSIVQNQQSLNDVVGKGNQIINYDYHDIIEANMHKIQEKNCLPTNKLYTKSTMTFDIEMETGTGKTYVFLKTILKLNKEYGFSKFIITVPSIAIKEGVLKNLQITYDHFRKEFENINYKFFEYNSSNLSQIYEFQRSSNVQIMIINIQSFDKEKNIFNISREQLSGNKPIDLIKQTNPIVIIDEPQSTASTQKSMNAIESLNPLFILRYSATFKKRTNHENLIYKLDAVDAYNKKIVKSIEVYGNEISNSNNDIQLLSVDAKKMSAKLKLLCSNGEYKEVKMTCKKSIYDITHRQEHLNLFIDEIIFDEPKVILNNQRIISKAKNNSADEDEAIKRHQIKTTIKTHLNKQLALKKKNIKVLSLFFLDEVKNYRIYDGDQVYNGKYAEWFENDFIAIAKNEKYKPLFENKDIEQLAKKIHNGYFSMDKTKKFKNSTKGESKDDLKTYELIMKEKERLLSFDEPVSFIFSHSALKEGWDNPNVFQVCTLNTTNSEIRKRQQIGRGLRLCVDQNGERITNPNLNVLSIIANESYKQFADDLQRELKEDGFVARTVDYHTFMHNTNNIIITEELSKEVFKYLNENDYLDDVKPNEKCFNDISSGKFTIPNVNANQFNHIKNIIECTNEIIRIKNAREVKRNKINKDVLNSNDFKLLWSSINQKTKYCVKFNNEDFIKRAKEIIEEKVENTPCKQLLIYKTKINLEAKVGVKTGNASLQVAKDLDDNDNTHLIAGTIENLINSNSIKKKDIIRLICETSLIDKLKTNPLWVEKIVNEAISQTQDEILINGIEYIPIDEYYEQSIIEEDLVQEINLNNEENVFIIDDKDSTKVLFDFFKCDSAIELDFLNESVESDYVNKIIKLPRRFTIDTPLGKYNPDWAILNQNKISLVVETKGSNKISQLRLTEKQKIECGSKHFDSLKKNVNFYLTDKLDEIIKKDSNGK